jgi:dephospho-CoA kinase
MIKVGITGGIGSGKTTVCKLFETLDVPVYYADDRAKKLMTSNAEVKKAISHLFGNEAYYRNGRLNRPFISAQVFKNKPMLKKLNAIVHPAVKIDGDQWFAEQHTKFALKEAALLIESGSYKSMDKLIGLAG